MGLIWMASLRWSKVHHRWLVDDFMGLYYIILTTKTRIFWGSPTKSVFWWKPKGFVFWDQMMRFTIHQRNVQVQFCCFVIAPNTMFPFGTKNHGDGTWIPSLFGNLPNFAHKIHKIGFVEHYSIVIKKRWFPSWVPHSIRFPHPGCKIDDFPAKNTSFLWPWEFPMAALNPQGLPYDMAWHGLTWWYKIGVSIINHSFLDSESSICLLTMFDFLSRNFWDGKVQLWGMIPALETVLTRSDQEDKPAMFLGGLWIYRENQSHRIHVCMPWSW